MSVTKITKAMMADESTDSDNYVDGSIDTAHIATNQIDETLMKDAFVGDFTDATVTASDYFLHGDATDSGNTKKDTIQGILDLAGGGTTLGTPVATTSGTSHTFTGIPSGTKRITINFYRADTNGTEASIVQLGDAGGFETSGYIGSKHRSDTGGDAAVTTGMAMMTTINDALTTSGSMVLSLVDASTFSWVSTCMLGRPDGYLYSGGSSKSLSAELTQIKLLQESGSSTYDGGKMNIIYE